MSTEETAAYTWVAEHMPTEVAQALAQFVAINPRQRGIDWWTTLDILCDCDAHLDIIEPVAEVFKEAGDAWTVLHSYVTLTLIYASRVFSVDWTTEQRVMAVRVTIDNNNYVGKHK
jgi:hypothetical protein